MSPSPTFQREKMLLSSWLASARNLYGAGGQVRSITASGGRFLLSPIRNFWTWGAERGRESPWCSPMVGAGGFHAPSPTHQPPIDEVGQAAAGLSTEISPVHPADLQRHPSVMGTRGIPMATPMDAGIPPLHPHSVPSGENRGCRQADRQTGRTQRVRYLVPSPIRGDGGGGCVAMLLQLQLPQEPARLWGESPGGPGSGGTNTDREQERRREKDGRQGEGMSPVPPWGTWCFPPRCLRWETWWPWDAHPSPSSRARKPGSSALTASSACTCSFAAVGEVG